MLFRRPFIKRVYCLRFLSYLRYIRTTRLKETLSIKEFSTILTSYTKTKLKLYGNILHYLERLDRSIIRRSFIILLRNSIRTRIRRILKLVGTSSLQQLNKLNRVTLLRRLLLMCFTVFPQPLYSVSSSKTLNDTLSL